MKLHVLFGQRKESYEGEYAPEPLLCWSEYEVDENPEGFDEAVRAAEAKPDFLVTRMFDIIIDQDAVREGLLGNPVLQGIVRAPAFVK